MARAETNSLVVCFCADAELTSEPVQVLIGAGSELVHSLVDWNVRVSALMNQLSQFKRFEQTRCLVPSARSYHSTSPQHTQRKLHVVHLVTCPETIKNKTVFHGEA